MSRSYVPGMTEVSETGGFPGVFECVIPDARFIPDEKRLHSDSRLLAANLQTKVLPRFKSYTGT